MASIWLRPEGRQEQRLQELINRLAEEHGTVKFAPHLTVCGIPDDLAVLDAAADYVRHCGLLPLRVARSTVTGAVITPFRAVFIEIENSPELREFRERLKAIAAGCAEAIDDAYFTLGRPVVNSAGGGEQDVRSWNVIRSL
jgi:2'-5' RNA ligase